MANNVQITIGADASNAESALKKFQGSVRKAGLALSAMGAGGALAIKGFTSAALEQERALKTLAAVVENTGESFSQVEAKILAATSALQKKSNFGDEEQIRVLAKLVPMLGSTDAALAALPAALELAAVTGKDLSSVVDTMGPVLAGVTDRIRGTTLEFTAAQGPTERLAQIMEVLGGSAEADMDPFRQLSMAMGDLSEKIGDALLPIIVPLIEKLTAFAEKLQTLNPRILQLGAGILAAVTAIGLIGGPLLLFISLVPAMTAGLGTVTAGIVGMKAAVFALNVSMLANPIALAILAIVAAVTILYVAWDQDFWKMKDITENVVNYIITDLKKWYDMAVFVIGGVNKLLGRDMPESIASAKDAVADSGIVNAFQESLGGLAETFGNVFGDIKDKVVEWAFPTGEEAGEGLGAGIQAGLDASNPELGTDGLFGSNELLESIKEMTTKLGIPFEEAQKRIDGLVQTGLISQEGALLEISQHYSRAIDAVLSETLKGFDEIAETADEATARMAAAAEAAAARIAAAFGNMGGELGLSSKLVGIGANKEDLVARSKEGWAAGLRDSALSAFINKPITDAIAGMADGGIVGGPKGSPQLRVLHGGEMVLNDEQQSGMGSTFNITVNGNVDDPAQMARLIADQVNAILGESSIRNEATRSR